MSEQNTQRVPVPCPVTSNVGNSSPSTTPSPKKRTPSLPVYIPRDDENSKLKMKPVGENVIKRSHEQTPQSQRSSENVLNDLFKLEQQNKQLLVLLESKKNEINQLGMVNVAHREKSLEFESRIKETNGQQKTILEAKDSKINNLTNEIEKLKQKTKLEKDDLILQIQELNAKITEIQKQGYDRSIITGKQYENNNMFRVYFCV